MLWGRASALLPRFDGISLSSRHLADGDLGQRTQSGLLSSTLVEDVDPCDVERGDSESASARSALDVAGEDSDQGQNHGDGQRDRRGDEGGNDVLAQRSCHDGWAGDLTDAVPRG